MDQIMARNESSKRALSPYTLCCYFSDPLLRVEKQGMMIRVSYSIHQQIPVNVATRSKFFAG
jgi:hypothetical protein